MEKLRTDFTWKLPLDTIMSATSVWVHLYYEGKDKPNGDPVRIYQSDVPRDRVWDIGTLKGLVHKQKSKSLEHCDPDDLTVYPPKTCDNRNRYKPGKKLSECWMN